MVKADLAQIVYERHGGITHREAKEIVDLIIQRMKSTLLEGDSVKLTGFGSLNVIERKARRGRNPQTGDKIQLGPSRYITFRPSRTLTIDHIP